MEEFYEQEELPLQESELFGEAVASGGWTHASVVCLQDGTWNLSGVFVPVQARGQGYGRRLLEQVVLWADTRGHRLRLKAVPFMEGGLSPDLLQAFYSSFAFETVGGDSQGGWLMEREPQEL